MNKIILDASALLALIKNESGADIVEALIGRIIMSSANVSEVAAFLLRKDISLEECKEYIEPFVETIVPFDLKHAYNAAALQKQTANKGLSLGDRACLALGIQTGYPVYTADKVWLELDLDCRIILIR